MTYTSALLASRLGAAIAVLVFVLSATSTSAQAPPFEPATEAPERVAPRSRGTHYFLELQAGAALPEPHAPAGALVFGTGGRLSGTPLRFYFVTEVGADRRMADQAGSRGRSIWFMPGVRMYLPLLAGLRLSLEAGAGGIHMRDTVGEFTTPLVVRHLRPQLSLGVGLQYRFFERLSLGVRMQRRFIDRQAARRQVFERRAWTATAGATWHF